MRVVAPVDQRYPLAAVEVKVTFEPGQMFNVPLAEMIGIVGPEAAFTVTAAEVPEQVPFPAVTV